jgi:Flp pilus assembly CpaE family ATPase
MSNTEYRVLLVEDNAVNALMVRKMLERVDNPRFQMSHADSLVKALDLLAAGGFDAALVDLNLPDSAGLETFLAIQRNAPGVAIVILSGCDDEALSMKAVELGAQDYLSKADLSSHELVRALQYGVIRSRKTVEERRTNQPTGSILAFLGSKGGVGLTTLACHTAREWKRQTGEDVLLTGIDRNAAGVAYLMKANSQYTLVDAAQNLHRLDADLWKAFVQDSEGVDVLAPAGAANVTGQIEPDRVRHVLRFARGVYPRIVLDLGVLDPLSLTLLEDANQVVVVASEDLPALWEAGRLLKRLTQLGIPGESIRFVLNLKKRRGGVSVGDLEKALGHPCFGSVGAALEEQEDSLAEGRFVDEKSPIRKDVARVVAKLLGKDAPEQPGGFRFSRLVRGQ